MAQLLLINPRSRGESKMATRKKPRSAAQKAATKRMIAANRRGKNPTKRVAVASATFPKRRTKRALARRTNPIRASFGAARTSVTGLARTSAAGAAGAIAVNTLSNYLPLPAALKTGYGRTLTRAALAIAVGLYGKKIMPQKIASDVAVGTLTVALHELMLSAAAKIPGVRFDTPLAGLGAYDDINGLSEYDLNAYYAESMDGVSAVDGDDDSGVGAYDDFGVGAYDETGAFTSS